MSKEITNEPSNFGNKKKTKNMSKMILSKSCDKSWLRYRNMTILLTDVTYHYCVANKDLFFDKTKLHTDKDKTVLKSHDMDLCLLLTHIVTFCFADQVTYIERLRPTL